MIYLKTSDLVGHPIHLSKEMIEDGADLHDEIRRLFWKQIDESYLGKVDIGVSPQPTAEDEAEMKAQHLRSPLIRFDGEPMFSLKFAADLLIAPVYKDSWDRQLHEYGHKCACGECGCLGAKPTEYVGMSAVEITLKCWRCGYEWSITKQDVPNE